MKIITNDIFIEMDVDTILESVGYLGIFIAVFIECGVPIGIVLPLPGFSLLFTAGVFASSGTLELSSVIALGLAGAILGYIVGYLTGYRYGRKLFYELKTKRYFTPQQGKRAERFMKRWGYSTLIIGRFLAIVHNIAPILGGIARMKILPFMVANVVGAIIWVCSAAFAGFYLGENVPNAQYYIIPLVVFVLLLVNTPQGRRLLNNITERVEKL